MFSSNIKGKGDTCPDDIPKQDLLNLCMKLNKRMKSLESKGQEMAKKYDIVLSERNSLMNLIAVTTDIPIDEGEDGNIDHIKDILLHHLNSHKITNKELNDKIFSLEEKVDAYTRSDLMRDDSNSQKESSADVTRLEERNEKLKNKVYTLELSMQEKDTKIAYLEKKIELSAENDTTETSTVHNMEGSEKNNQVTSEVETLERIVEEQKRKLSSANTELEKLRRAASEADNKGGASSLLKAEQEALLFSLRKDLTAALHLKETNETKIKELEEYRIRTEGKLCNLVESKDKVFQYEVKLDEASATITRLQGRLQAAETALAMRTADFANVEQQISTLQEKFEKKMEEVAATEAAAVASQKQVRHMENTLLSDRRTFETKLLACQHELDCAAKTHKEAITEMRNDFDDVVNELKRDSTKKSHAARVLLEEKIEALRVLTERNVALKEEIDSGHPADRKIFELASKQASRDVNMHSSRDARELAFQQLQASLATKDLDLARLQDDHRRLLSEVAELRCVKNRETVNMDYLKNIVLQYMSFPPSSPERAGLVPVISLLLQFSEEETVQASSGASKESLLWSSRPVKDLKVFPTPLRTSHFL
mmetsp:Transcript_658/g.1525  ORF Transcript_658/g.1525 Transcript_658/m.1525 type:complete len:598 (+) Transcript_658:194-1987(+)